MLGLGAMPKHRNIFIAIALIFSIFLWTWVLLTYGTDAIVDYIGVKNGYLIVFLVALFGGMSSVSGVTYVATIITFASAGLNPFGLALASCLGISIGDTIFYYIGKYGVRELADSTFKKYIVRFAAWLEQRSATLRFTGIYVYTAFTPLPNDVLTILLGVSHQRLALVLPALVAGNFTLTLLLSLFGGSLEFLA